MSRTLADEMSTAHDEHGLPVNECLEFSVEELLRRARLLPPAQRDGDRRSHARRRRSLPRSRPRVTAPRGPIVIDTDGFSADLSDTALIERYEPIIVGRPAFLFFQTVAELRFGAIRRGWGEARVRRLDAKIGATEVVHSGDGPRHRLRPAARRLPERRTCPQPTRTRRRSLDRRHSAPPRRPARVERPHLRGALPGCSLSQPTADFAGRPARVPTPHRKTLSGGQGPYEGDTSMPSTGTSGTHAVRTSLSIMGYTPESRSQVLERACAAGRGVSICAPSTRSSVMFRWPSERCAFWDTVPAMPGEQIAEYQPAPTELGGTMWR